MTPAFVHLRLHTEYSLSDGMVRVKPLLRAVRDKGMPAVAITDNNNLFAQVKFQNAAEANGIKAIVASDVWVSAEGSGEPVPLVLIARNNTGYRNLSELISDAYVNNRVEGVAVIRRADLAAQADGLIALSGGCRGDIGQALLAGNADLARSLLHEWMEIFPGGFYLELHRTGRAGEEDYLHAAVALAARMDCPVVATNDVCFLTEEEFEAHEVRVCIHDGRTLDDPRRESRHSRQQYLKSPEEMVELFQDIPEAVENTIEIARRCNVNLDLGNYYLPEYPIPDGMTKEAYLEEVARRGLDERLARILDVADPDFAAKRKPYDDRLAFELNVINNMGFPGYFLIVMEFIQWAKENDIPVGPGRGSGAGSLVAFALQITNIDPLAYDLLFERFLNPERVSLPDFDIDFCMDGRDRVIQHVMERYGRKAVSQIITFGTMAAKAVVRDVARVQGKPYGLADRLSKLIPFDPGMTLEKALEIEPMLVEFIGANEDAQEIMDMAFQLEGLARNVGKHAGGVVIAPTKITDFCPIYCDDGGNFMTQYNMIDVEQAGLVKFDFLGLRTLTIIDNAVKSINLRRSGNGESPLDIDLVPLEDASIYDDLRHARTTAVFQLESRGMKDLMKKVRPERFGDIVALVALFRPGPMQLADDFIKRKNDPNAAIDYYHPRLKPVLQDTYGVMLYQEQVMQIAQVLAGYTLADADLLRRAMGKKKPEEMKKQREVFKSGAVANGVDEGQAEHIFDLMEKFAGYGFNKPHSVAYALVAYQTAWLKHYYPADFMAACLSADMQTTDKVVINIEESREIGLEITPPDVNRGEFRFVADGPGTVVYGLGAIKGLGEGQIEALVAAREAGGPFTDLYDFCARVDSRKINRRAIEALINSGALDRLVPDCPANVSAIDYRRSLLKLNLEDAIGVAEQKARNEESGHVDLFGEATFMTAVDGQLYNHTDSLRVMNLKERLQGEKESLGLYLTGHPIDSYKHELRHLAKTRIVDLRVSKDEQTIVGLITNIRTMKNKKNETVAFITLDDKSGRLEVSVFADLYEQHYAKLAKDAVVVVKGATAVDDFTAGIRMRASEVFDLREARERSVKRLKLSLNGCQLPDGFAVDLADILSPFRGAPGEGCPVSIAYQREDAEAEVMLGDTWRVTPDDDLIEHLKDRYGSEQVYLDYQ
ncbi:MAG: DNA polymerase III subunit alpha [Pseudomonadota bacterium]